MNATRYSALTLIVLLRWLVDDRRMLQTSQIEHAYAAVCATAHEYIYATSAEPDIEHLLVVRNELGLCSQSRNIPYCASRVNR